MSERVSELVALSKNVYEVGMLPVRSLVFNTKTGRFQTLTVQGEFTVVGDKRVTEGELGSKRYITMLEHLHSKK